jgi:ankyrin repeat protein
VEELAEVLAVDFDATGGIPILNEDLRWEDQEQAVLFACSSLIAVVQDDSHRLVQFSHFSVKEFLTSDRLATSTIDASHYHHILPEPSHRIMAQACLSVLLRLDSHTKRDNLKDLPLARYASQHFGDHAEFGNVFGHIQDGIDDLLDADKPHFAAWLSVRENFEGPPERPEASPLYHVAGFGFRAMVDYLISKRPENLSVRGYYGIPLHASLRNGCADVALLLLGLCMDVDVRGNDDRTPLHMAVSGGLLEVTRTLIGRGATINARDSNGRTPLHPTYHTLNGTFDDQYFDVMRCLLEHGADVDSQANTAYPTPLHLASYLGGFKVAQLLLDHGADINVRDKNGRTPLHGTLVDLTDGLSDYFFDIVRFLLEHGADVYALDNDHATPLHVASQCGGTKAARLLLEHGADVHALDDNHSTPLHFASKGYNAEAVHLLLVHGADVHALDNNHSTPLHHISEHGDAGAACELLEHGAVIDARDSKGSTPLQVASYCGNASVARVLLEHGANIDTRNKDDQTPRNILLTLWNGKVPDDDIDTIRFFLERGADVDAVDHNHLGLLHAASCSGSIEVARLLLKHGANIDVRNSWGQTPLHRALVEIHDNFDHKHFDGIQLFLEHGAGVDALDNYNSTPLHVASRYGSVRATRLLLKHGANVHLLNNAGHTPSQVASANGHEETARLLSEHLQSEQKM